MVRFPSMKRVPRILLVDDNTSMTTVCCRALKLSGDYEVREVNDASTAVRTALEFRPDLILLDVFMPDVNGDAVLIELRTYEELATTRVAFLTGRRPANLELDANTSFIAKPIPIPELVAIVESIIAEIGDRIV